MQKFKKAPCLELENYKAPKGANFIFIPMPDNKKIRLAYWKKDKSNRSFKRYKGKKFKTDH